MWRTVILVLLSTVTRPATAGPPDIVVPQVKSAEPAADWNAKFVGHSNWLGGDCVYSAQLAPNRILWLFGDTLVSPKGDGKRPGSKMVNNTIALLAGRTSDAAIEFIVGRFAKPSGSSGTEDRPSGAESKSGDSNAHDDGNQASFFLPADGKGYFWPQAAVRAGERVYLFLAQVESTERGGPFGFRHTGQSLAVIENPDDGPDAWQIKQHKIPFVSFRPQPVRSWGSAVLRDGEYLYVYGYDERERGFGKRRLVVARAPGDKLEQFDKWQFLTTAERDNTERQHSANEFDKSPRRQGCQDESIVLSRNAAQLDSQGRSEAEPLDKGRNPNSVSRPGDTTDDWSDNPTDAAPLFGGLATEFSVSALPNKKGYVLIYTENGIGPRIVARFANSPTGPWSEPLLLYTCPEPARDRGIFTYAAKAHAWATTSSEAHRVTLLVSYCTNAHDFWRLFRDTDVYYPRFVSVELEWR